MTERRTDDELTRLLRESDPLREGLSLDLETTRTMRRKILTEVPGSTPSHWRVWSPTVSVVAMLVIALVVAWWPRPDLHSTAPPVEIPETTGTSSQNTDEGHIARQSRTIQFETPGGTFVVWVLDPNFPS